MSAIEDTQDRTVESEAGDDPLLGEFQSLKKDIIASQRARGKWRKEAEECYDYVAGHQWSEEDSGALAAQNRPAVVFNRIDPLIKAVCGLEVNNRQAVIYLPRTVGSSGPNEMVTATGKWVRDECNAEDEESEAFRDDVICGEGWTEMRMDYDEDPQGKIIKERIDPLEMGVNKGACRANYVDARMIYRIREMDPADVRALLDLPDELSDAAMDASPWLEKGTTPEDGGQGNKKDYPDVTRDGVTSRPGVVKTVQVIQCQYWKREPINMVATSGDQEPQEMTDEEFQVFSARAQATQSAAQLNPEVEAITFDHARVTKKRYYECFIGVRILDQKPMEMNEFQFKAMTGQRDRKLKCFYGMVRGMLDPQRWSNKFLSQTMHHINVNAKGGLLAETDAFLNVKKAEKDWADPTKIVWVKPGTLQKQKIKERTSIALPPGLDQLMMFAISSIRDVTGINLELLGQADREQAASLEQQRRQSAMTILATMFDSLRKYRKLDGRLMLHFMKLLPDNTIVRIVEQGQIQYIPFVKEGVEFEKFDTIIDEAPTSPDQKQFVWAVTAQILQMNILPPQAIIALLKYSPYPESVVQEIQKALGLGDEMPPEQLKEKLQQAEGALQVMEGKLKEALENQKTAEDERAIEMLKLEVDEYRAETERLKAEWDSRIAAAGAVVDAHVAGQPPAGAGGKQVTSGEQQLPDVGGGQTPGLEEKVNALHDMVTQIMEHLSPQAPPPEAPPEELPPEMM